MSEKNKAIHVEPNILAWDQWFAIQINQNEWYHINGC